VPRIPTASPRVDRAPPLSMRVVHRGAARRIGGWRRRTKCQSKDSSQPIGAPSEGGLRGLTQPVLRGRICKSPVRRTPASCFSATRCNSTRSSPSYQTRSSRSRRSRGWRRLLLLVA
jgi:hypothetical protein